MFVFQSIFIFLNSSFIAMLLFLVILGLIFSELVLLGYSVVLIFKKFKMIKIKSIFPLLFCILFFVQINTVPQAELIRDFSFKVMYKKRMEVVEMYEKGKLNHNNDGWNRLALPKGYKFLSDSGAVSPLGSDLMFYESRGLEENFTAYIYSKKGSPSTNEDINFDINYIKKIDKHWYYIAGNY